MRDARAVARGSRRCSRRNAGRRRRAGRRGRRGDRRRTSAPCRRRCAPGWPARRHPAASGRPWATSQNEQRRVQTSPRIMKVAVPWPKHSWMFGQLASSHTVTRRFSRSLALSVGDRVARRDAHADPRRLAQHRRIGELHRRARDLVAARPASRPAAASRTATALSPTTASGMVLAMVSVMLRRLGGAGTDERPAAAATAGASRTGAARCSSSAA